MLNLLLLVLLLLLFNNTPSAKCASAANTFVYGGDLYRHHVPYYVSRCILSFIKMLYQDSHCIRYN